MEPNKLSPERKSRVLVYLITLVTMAIAAVIFVGCKTNDNQNGTVQNPTPSASPRPSGTPDRLLLPGDTIIVVKDGSVHIDVNETLCSDDGSSATEKKYRCNVELEDVVVRSPDYGQAPPRYPKANGNTTITIDGGGGADKGIEIKGNGNHVTIKFKQGSPNYEPCPGGGGGQFCGTNNVGTVKVDTHEKTCNPADKCEIWVRKK